MDSEKDTWNMDPVLLEEAIKDRLEKTGRLPKVIIPVHLYGMPGKLDEILEVAKRYDIPVLEDSAEALGSSTRGRSAGRSESSGRYHSTGTRLSRLPVAGRWFARAKNG